MRLSLPPFAVLPALLSALLLTAASAGAAPRPATAVPRVAKPHVAGPHVAEPHVAELVADLAPLGTGGGSEPRGFYKLGARSVFFAFQPGSGYEPWSTDGTPGGTELLADTCPGPCPTGRTDLQGLAVAGDQLFWAESPGDGAERYLTRLWRSDGTAAGTYPLTDAGSLLPIAGGSRPYVVPLGGRPAAAERLLFLAFTLRDDASPGTVDSLQLWTTDGSPEGTRRVADLVSSLESDVQSAVLLASAGRAHVLLYEETLDRPSIRLWVSDGTAGGTRLLDEMEGRGITHTASAGGRVFFNFTSDSMGGWEVWSAGDTPESVGSLGRRFIGTDWRGSFPWIAAVGDQVVFPVAEVRGDPAEPVDTYQLWASDGTPGGTRPLTAFRSPDPLPVDLAPENLAVLGNHLLFPVQEVVEGSGPPFFDPELWSAPLDGRAGAAVRVADLCPGCSGMRPPALGDALPKLIRLADGVYFAGTDDGATTSLWRTDGTAVTRACPAASAACSDVSRVLALPGRQNAEDILFLAGEPEGDDLWRLDPGGGVPRRLTRFSAPEPFPTPSERAPWTGASPAGGGAFLIAARNGPRGEEPWIAAGADTRPLRDIHQAAAGSEPRQLTALGDLLLFTASEEGRLPGDLWAASPPAAGAPGAPPKRIFELARPSLCFRTGIRGLAAAESLAYFFCGREELELEIWRTDGTAEGTFRVAEPGGLTSLEDRLAGDIILTDAARWGDRAYFAVNTEAGIEIWETDGTAAGTGPVASIPGDDTANPAIAAEALTAGGTIFLRGRDVLGGPAVVWSSDGTQAGTARRLTFPFGYVMDLSAWRASGGAVFLPLQQLGGDNLQLWRTDGTDAGTGLVVEIPDRLWLDGTEVYGGPPGLQDPPLAPDFYFLVGDGPLGALTLWTVPASASTAVEAGPAGLTASVPVFREAELTAGLGRVFFVARDPEHGTELWSSDGTARGTRMVVDGNPGPASSAPRDLTGAQGRLFFTANDGEHGLEPWLSNGTAEGTWMVHDLAPGAASAGNRPADPAGVPPLVHTPGGYTPVADRLYFRADDGIFGEEPWSLPLAGGLPCEPSAEHLCLAGGRFQVEVAAPVPVPASGSETARVVRGTARPLSADTGALWLFREVNLELAVKVLDGRPVNGHFWVFYTALSNLPFALTVTDHATGLTRRYEHPGGAGVSAGDTAAFGPRGVPLSRSGLSESIAAEAPVETPEGGAPRRSALLPASPASVAERGTCQAGSTRLCLLDGRYAVEVVWTRKNGTTGPGRPIVLSEDAVSETGAFWFFREANLELFVKMVDGSDVNGHVWFFYGALSNVGYRITVTETATGRTRTYDSPAGSFTSAADGRAFDVIP